MNISVFCVEISGCRWRSFYSGPACRGCNWIRRKCHRARSPKTFTYFGCFFFYKLFRESGVLFRTIFLRSSIYSRKVLRTNFFLDRTSRRSRVTNSPTVLTASALSLKKNLHINRSNARNNLDGLRKNKTNRTKTNDFSRITQIEYRYHQLWTRLKFSTKRAELSAAWRTIQGRGRGWGRMGALPPLDQIFGPSGLIVRVFLYILCWNFLCVKKPLDFYLNSYRKL